MEVVGHFCQLLAHVVFLIYASKLYFRLIFLEPKRQLTRSRDCVCILIFPPEPRWKFITAQMVIVPRSTLKDSQSNTVLYFSWLVNFSVPNAQRITESVDKKKYRRRCYPHATRIFVMQNLTSGICACLFVGPNKRHCVE